MEADPCAHVYTDEHLGGGLGAILHQENPFQVRTHTTLPAGTNASTTLRTSPTISVHVPPRGRRHPTTAGDITPQAISVTGGQSPARRGEQPAPMLTHQSYLTR